MGKPNFSDEFKRDAVAQITGRGYPVAEVSERLARFTGRSHGHRLQVIHRYQQQPLPISIAFMPRPEGARTNLIFQSTLLLTNFDLLVNVSVEGGHGSRFAQ